MQAWFAQRSGENYRSAVEQGALWIAESEGEPVGFTEFFPGLISMLFVRGTSSGRGWGRRLLNFAITGTSAGSADPIRLESTLNAEAFYRRNGFEALGPSHLSRPGGVLLPTILMVRRR
jgi:GNAT superfamily N-acetyltransferase